MFRKKQKTGGDPHELIYADTGADQAAKPRRQGRLRVGALVTALALVLGAVLGTVTLGIALRNREARYAAARALVQDKSYPEALAVFRDLGDYRDSRLQAQQLLDQQAAYENAAALLDQQRYEEALAIFRSLGNYSDSAQMAACQVTYRKALDLLTEIDTGKTQLLTRILSDRVKLTDERSYPTIVGYETAAALLESLGDYRSAPALLDRCYYSAGLVKLGWEDWDGALAYMEKMTQETAAEFYQEYQQHYSEKAEQEGP